VRVRLVFIASFTMTCACAARSSSQGIPVPGSSRQTENTSSGCALIAEPGERIATVALSERVNPANAPHPSNESERILFRQMYETLLRMDCNGKIQNGLASSWKLDTATHAWIISLREDAQYADGTPLLAPDAVSGWMVANSDELRPEVRNIVESVVAIDKRTLSITLKYQHPDGPAALAHTDLAIVKRAPGQLWPMGTRGVNITSNGEAITLIQTNTSISTRFLVTSGGDSRDLLDQGVDLLVTRDTNTLNYAATLPQFISVPLVWQRVYVLLTPGRPPRTSPPLAIEARETLAHDAVRGESRGAIGPFWWESLSDCQVPTSQPSVRSSNGRVVFDAADSVARDLADRLVGLRNYQRAAGLTGSALNTALRRGDDAGYILPIERHPLEPCHELQTLFDGAGWLNTEAIVPLVDTRMKAIVRQGRAGLNAEWDGGLLLVDGRK